MCSSCFISTPHSPHPPPPVHRVQVCSSTLFREFSSLGHGSQGTLSRVCKDRMLFYSACGLAWHDLGCSGCSQSYCASRVGFLLSQSYNTEMAVWSEDRCCQLIAMWEKYPCIFYPIHPVAASTKQGYVVARG